MELSLQRELKLKKENLKNKLISLSNEERKIQ